MASVFYEIATSQKPYHNKEDHVLEDLYAAGKFPETSHLLLGPVIQKCWEMQYEDVAEVLDDRQHFQRRSLWLSFSLIAISILTGVGAAKLIWTNYSRLRYSLGFLLYWISTIFGSCSLCE